MADIKAVRATLVTIYGRPDGLGEPTSVTQNPGEIKTLVCTADGDLRFTITIDGSTDWDSSYDHGTGVLRNVRWVGQPECSGTEWTGLAPGMSGTILFSSYLADPRVATRALRELSDAVVTEVTYQGRPAWVLSSQVRRNFITGTGFDQVEITVDQETGFPVQVLLMSENAPVGGYRLEDLEIDPDLDADSFHLQFPAGAEVERIDSGFVRLDLRHLRTEAADVVGYVPVLPEEVPEGFVLKEVCVAEEGQASGKEGMNPPAAGVVSAIYRRGFEELIVSTRLVGDDPSAWSDPMATGEGYVDTPERVALSSGAFTRNTAEILINILTPPHLWAMNDSLVVTVSGDLTRDELLAVAESLAPVE
jgi:hypothetical protein